MKEQTLHTWIGAGVVSFALAVAVWWNTGKPEVEAQDGYHLVATYSKIDGLGVGSQVLLAGIPIGQVVSETIDPETHQVTLAMTIDPEIELPIDSSAQITSDGIFGGKYISVNVGGEFDMLADGDSFEFIRDSIIFEEVFETILKMGEEGLRKKQEEKAAEADKPAFNPFATDPSLLPNLDKKQNNGTDIMEDPFDSEGEGPL